MNGFPLYFRTAERVISIIINIIIFWQGVGCRDRFWDNYLMLLTAIYYLLSIKLQILYRVVDYYLLSSIHMLLE